MDKDKACKIGDGDREKFKKWLKSEIDSGHVFGVTGIHVEMGELATIAVHIPVDPFDTDLEGFLSRAGVFATS